MSNKDYSQYLNGGKLDPVVKKVNFKDKTYKHDDPKQLNRALLIKYYYQLGYFQGAAKEIKKKINNLKQH